ncbi:MAG: Spy/CpxP family protein refolding chaperone, partial [Ignavibacterium sp.]
MKTKFFLAVAAILVLGIISDSFAQMERMKMREKMRDRMEERLNLTDAQKSKVEELRTNHQKKMIDLKASLEKKKVELRSLRNSEKLNRSDLLKLTKEISEIRNSMAVEMANHHMDIYE